MPRIVYASNRVCLESCMFTCIQFIPFYFGNIDIYRYSLLYLIHQHVYYAYHRFGHQWFRPINIIGRQIAGQSPAKCRFEMFIGLKYSYMGGNLLWDWLYGTLPPTSLYNKVRNQPT